MVTLFSCLTMFGGGVILTSCLTHMLPDVNEVCPQLLGQLDFKIQNSGVPQLPRIRQLPRLWASGGRDPSAGRLPHDLPAGGGPPPPPCQVRTSQRGREVGG